MWTSLHNDGLHLKILFYFTRSQYKVSVINTAIVLLDRFTDEEEVIEQQQDEELNIQDGTQLRCVACLNEGSRVLFQDCRHLCACVPCAKRFTRTKEANAADPCRRCPACWTRITKSLVQNI